MKNMEKFFVTSNSLHNIILPYFNTVYSSLCCSATNCDTILQTPICKTIIQYIQHMLVYVVKPVDATLKSTWPIAEKACLCARTKLICCQYATRAILRNRFFRFCFA